MASVQRNVSDIAVSLSMVLMIGVATARFIEEGMNIYFWWWIILLGAPLVLVVTIVRRITLEKNARLPKGERD
ncbi:hypothetical protein NOGI109294_02400 [Nocardiopsis gilva]